MPNVNRKGKSAEKELCKFLQVWAGISFKKTDRSGADRNYEYSSYGLDNSFVGATHEYIVSNVGDCVPANDFNYFGFVVESKHYKDFSKIGYSKKNASIILPTSQIAKFFTECQNDCDRLNKIGQFYNVKNRKPILFLRENKMRKKVLKGHEVQSFHVCLGAEFYPHQNEELQDKVVRCCFEKDKLWFFSIHSKDLPDFVNIEDYLKITPRTNY